MKVLSRAARERCETDEIRFLQALSILLQDCPERLVLIDETHKDRNASRKRRGWSRRNCETLLTHEWFQSVVRYTLIAAADINGFIVSACHTVLRDTISEEGAAGTVDGDYFLYWVKNYLCPVLGNYELGEPRSIVYMDNASTHMADEVEDAIRGVGAFLIYGPPYSPHLNPIESFFGRYKAHLKRNEIRMLSDWHSVHLEGLDKIDRDQGIRIFRHFKIPGAKRMLTLEEYNKLVSLMN